MAGLGSTPGIIVGVGVGAAAAAAIEPVVELPRQAAWRANPVRLLDPAVMARLVASGGVDLGVAQDDGKGEGYGEDKINALVYLAQTVPGFAEAMTMWRRGTISDDDFAHTLVKAALDARYYPAVEALKDEWLTPAQIALGIIRGLIEDPGLLAVDLDTSGSNVPTYPRSTIDALTEALGGGVDTDRLRVLVGTIGLPPGVQQLASMVFRDIITEGAYNQGVMEGDARPEWAPYWLEQARQILSANEYTELQLRGFYTEATRRTKTAQHGMSQEDSDDLYDVLGRAPSVHQIVVGLARGGVYPGSYANIPDPYKSAIQRSNIREEFAELVYAGRYGYPSGFQIKAEAVAGDTNQADTEAILLEIGWDPKWAAKYSAAWAGKTTGATSVKKETVSLLTQEYLAGVLSEAAFTAALEGMNYTAQQAGDLIANANYKATSAVRTKNTKLVEKQYVGLTTPETTARAQLAQLGWPQGVIDNYINAWNIERDIALTTLTANDIEKALKAGALTPAAATPLLQALGESAASIATIIATYVPPVA